ncbi:3-keto-disaccharide hydrolase [Lignipirellula cremea]|uniref:3-keto-alpha-glucoside-1,2-lyase/3-keto-2-hydroxy-glucal hydratase domain-containing protein n=1 Tax=Lignipirellula cremea TaxID=2528010 RepID=A0A518DYK2_9BACT|nr:DUF1080 domain-containing protein [Lignipirellula cremea]QDU96881.1 hypothetical protein Pla8534_47030 [Lignipirellula cremea]
MMRTALLLAGCWLLTFSAATAEEPPEPVRPLSESWFNGKNLQGWMAASRDTFDQHGKVTVKNGELHLEEGQPATGIVRLGVIPRMNYEISLEAKRTSGSDFFCGLTFPVEQSYLTLIIGGWGGGVTGISNFDDMSAVENETTGYTEFKNDQWYPIRLRVIEGKVQAWLEDEQIIDSTTVDRRLNIWYEQEPMRPLGISAWRSGGAFRKIQLKRLTAKELKAAETEKAPTP